ncbi:MAG: hypothetical protein IJX91_00145 [Clostridia bacterium]|nr:hypothetical protein [Clostridia bacterium]
MLFRNVIRLLVENFKNVYKIMLYRLIVGVIAGALCCAMILPEILDIWNSQPMDGLIDGVQNFFISFFDADHTSLSAAKDSIFASGKEVLKLIGSKATTITLAVVGCVLVYLLKRIAETLCYFAVGSTLNDRMATYSETHFFTAFVANLGKAFVYALVYVPVVFVFDVLTIGLVMLLLSAVNIFAGLFFGITLIVLMQALKFTFTGLWLPAMTTDNKPLREAFRYANKTEKRQRSKVYATYIAGVYTVIVGNVLAAISTFGSALILTVPMSYMLFICLQYVYYYTIKGKKYFITYDKIASNPDYGDREHFFDYIDETANVSAVSENTEGNAEK